MEFGGHFASINASASIMQQTTNGLHITMEESTLFAFVMLRLNFQLLFPLTAFMSDTNPRVLNENRVLFLDLGINQSIAIKAESRQPSFGCWDGNPCGLGAMSVEKTLWEVTK